jgi:hypothetical protein
MVIKTIIEKPVAFLLQKMDLLSLYSLKRTGPLKEDGWLRSFREDACVDEEGNPVPWLTYPAVEFLKKRINREMSVFEYGCGASTLWWALRVKNVFSVEHDKTWYDKTVINIPRNVNLMHMEIDQNNYYSKIVKEYDGKFDIVVIDGRDRVNCAMNSVGSLKSNGIIIWDDSDRSEYQEGYRFLYDNGFRKIEFIGLAPIYNIKRETGIFYRLNNCLGI